MRIVLDTNLLIDSALDDFHFANRILDEVLSGKLDAYANRATLRENILLAERKVEDAEHLAKLERVFKAIQPAPDIKERIRVIKDREDNKLLESAVTARAEFLVTSDKEVLRLKEFEGIRIVSPTEFWAIYEDEKGDSWEKWVSDFMK